MPALVHTETPTESSTETETENPTENTEIEPEEEEEEEEGEEFSPAHLFLEDFVVTALLSAGRPLRGGEIAQRADTFVLPRQGLRESLKDSKLVTFQGREWDAIWRSSRKGLSREERSRQPVESMIRELLLAVGKPLPVPVIAREVNLMRNEFDPNMKASVANVLKGARFALEIVPDVWIHQNFLLSTGAPTDELLIRENGLAKDPDFEGLFEYAEITKKDPAGIARELMDFTGGPLSQKVIGFFAHRAAPQGFAIQKVSAALNDRAVFQPLISGFVMLQSQLAGLRSQVEGFLAEFAGPKLSPEAMQEMLKVHVSPSQVVQPRPDELEQLKGLAKAADGAPLELANVVLDVLEMEADDPKLVATLQGLNDAIRRDPAWLPSGVGRYILRETVPSEIGQIPDSLVPVTAKGSDAIDFELTDEGLEADCAEFVHSLQWEDVGEDAEVHFTKGNAPSSTSLVLLNHHLRAGTMKLRHMDEGLFEMNNGLARVAFRTGNNDPIIIGWASRDAGLIYGLGDWNEENLPPSGGTIKIERSGAEYLVTIETPNADTYLTPRRIDELEALRDKARNMSLHDLLGRLVGDHPAGMTLAAIWAEANVVRRTSKRLMASVLSAYDSFSTKQRGSQTLWQFDATKAKDGPKEGKLAFKK